MSEVVFDIDANEKKTAELENQTLRDGFWNNPEAARNILKEKSRAEGTVREWRKLSDFLQDLEMLFEMARDEDDENVLEEIEKDIVDLESSV
ncbi:MAG: PCRF domain-containing protein, partial [Deltaproteobacteria bacterium]|nr:PCRF domain-containing protein [Deltaproteobacteria bacterium]